MHNLTSATSNRARLRIQAIDVKFTPPSEYPIAIKLLRGDELAFKPDKIDKGQLFHWENITPIDVDLGDEIVIRVYEIHASGLWRERVGSVGFKVDEMLNTSSGSTFTGRCSSRNLSVTLRLMPSDTDKTAPQDTHAAAVTAVQKSPNLLEKMGRAREVVNALLRLNPIAKLVVGLFEEAWKTLEKQAEYDTLVEQLVTSMGELLPYIDEAELHARIRTLKDVIIEILRLVEDASRFVIEYKSDGSAVRAVKAFVTYSAQEQVNEFVKRFKTAKENFDRGMAVQAVATLSILLDSDTRSLLNELMVTGAEYDPSKGCLEETRLEVLRDIRAWATDLSTPQPFYWLHGVAGSGKSSVASSVSESLEKDGLLGGSFFCKRDDEQRRKPENVISTLAGCLAFKCAPYGIKLVEELRSNPRLPHLAAKMRFLGMISKPLQSLVEYKQPKTLVVIIDALDESGDGSSQKELVGYLCEMSKLVPWLKVLLTSRPTDDIHQAIEKVSEHVLRRNLFAENDSHVSRDIASFFRHHLAFFLAGMKPIPWSGDDVIQRLSNRSNGLFIWAQTACMLLLKSMQPEALLAKMLQGEDSPDAKQSLNKIYATVLTEALGSGTNDVMIIRHCVGAIVLTGTRKPLSEEALALLIGRDSKPDLSVPLLLKRLGSVLYKDGSGALRVLHQSFSDYMVDNDCPDAYRVDLEAQNTEMATSCLRMMSSRLKFNICNLETSFLRNKDVLHLKARVEKEIPSELEYCCMYWTSHIIAGSKGGFLKGSPNGDLLDGFLLKPQLLYWIECLSLLEKLHTATSSMQELMNWIENPQDQRAKCADDIYRFIFAAYTAIASSTPHLYVSALAFGAANFESVKELSRHFPNRVSVMVREGLWKLPCLRIIDSKDAVYGVAYSPDGRHIVSGSLDKTVRVWDAHTGAAVLQPLQGHSGGVYSVGYSPDGRHIVSGSSDKTVRVWDAHTGAAVLQPLQGHSDAVCSVGYSPDGRHIVSGSGDNTVRVWDAHTGAAVLQPLQGHSEMVWSVGYSPDGRHIVSGSYDKTVRVWDAHTGAAVLQPLQGHSDWVRSVGYSPDGRHIVSGSYDKTVRVWDAHTGAAVLQPLQGHSESVYSVGYSPNGRHIVSGSGDNTVRVWDAHTGAAVLQPLEGHSSAITSVGYSPDGRHIVSGSYDKTVRVWDAHTGAAVLQPLQGHSESVYSVGYSPNGRHIVSGSGDNTVRVWDAHTGAAVLQPLEGHSSAITSVGYSPDGRHIVSGSYDKTVRVWDAHTGAAVLQPLQGHSEMVWSVGYSPDGRHIVSGSYDKTVRVWDAHTGAAVLQPLQGHSSTITSVGYSPDGRHIVSGSYDKTVRVWDAHTGAAVLQPLEGHSSAITSVGYSPDGRHIVSGSYDKTVRVWDAHTGAAVLQPLQGHSSVVTSVGYSPDGRHIVSGSYDKTVRVWDAHTGAAVLQPLQGHSSAVTSVGYSPDGKHIVSGSWDNTVRVWDAHTGAAVLQPLEGHTDFVTSVGYSPDGRHIGSGSYDNTVRVWDAQTGAAVLQSLQGHSEEVRSVGYSLDDRHNLSDSHSVLQPCTHSQAPVNSSHKDAIFDDLLITGLRSLCNSRCSLVTCAQLNSFITDDGWLCTQSGQLILWIPHEYRRSMNDRSLFAISTAPEDQSVLFDFSRSQYGVSWDRDFEPYIPGDAT